MDTNFLISLLTGHQETVPVMACKRVGDGPSLVPSHVSYCKKCNEEVLVSDISLDLAVRKGLSLWCTQCCLEAGLLTPESIERSMAVSMEAYLNAPDLERDQ